MTSVASILRDEIARHGPLRFSRFMETALYHPEAGYYRRRRDPFGKQGDYFTAAQLQPVFGLLIAARLRQLRRELGEPQDFTVVELGAGRGEMAPSLGEFRYYPLEAGAGDWPERFTGVVFSNEFFDALPVDVAVRRGGIFTERLVSWEQGRFVWVEGAPLEGERAEYAARYLGDVPEGFTVEIHLEAMRWLERIAARLKSGFVLSIDYGYASGEVLRYPSGTLMSYRRHTASEDVLGAPGDQDITSHVPFTALQRRGEELGLECTRLESLARTLLEAGEEDSFAAVLAGVSGAEALRRRLQLKTLLFGMGERFRTLIQRKAGGK